MKEDGSVSYPDAGSPQGGVIAPPTKVQNFLIGAVTVFASLVDKKGEIDAVDDSHLLRLDGDSSNQGAKDFAFCCPVRVVQIG